MEAPVETLTIENVVGTTAIDQELDLDAVATDLSHAQFDPDNFPGLIYRPDTTQATMLIFRSGRIVLTGAKSRIEISEALDHLFTVFTELGIEVPDTPDPTIQNLVCGADFDRQLHLSAIAVGFGLEQVEYEPEQFPGLIYRLDDPDIVVLLFGSGKLVITGATRREQAIQALDRIHSQLNDLRLLE